MRLLQNMQIHLLKIPYALNTKLNKINGNNIKIVINKKCSIENIPNTTFTFDQNEIKSKNIINLQIK